MAFNFRADISIPGTVNGPFRVKAILGIRRVLGEDANSLTDKQAAELFCRSHIIAAYHREDAAVDGAEESAEDRTIMDTCRSAINKSEARVLALRIARRTQAELDWQ